MVQTRARFRVFQRSLLTSRGSRKRLTVSSGNSSPVINLENRDCPVNSSSSSIMLPSRPHQQELWWLRSDGECVRWTRHLFVMQSQCGCNRRACSRNGSILTKKLQPGPRFCGAAVQSTAGILQLGTADSSSRLTSSLDSRQHERHQ